jgi:predicted lactoylglutathione lyase
MIDHFNLPVTDPERSSLFYEGILEPLGYRFIMVDGFAIGFGVESWEFGIIATDPPFPKMHLAFEAISRQDVDRFFEAGVRTGAQSNGGPGLRPQYDPDYYATFVFDADGHNVEAVCRKPGSSRDYNV